jgi:hypothetical protein
LLDEKDRPGAGASDIPCTKAADTLPLELASMSSEVTVGNLLATPLAPGFNPDAEADNSLNSPTKKS